MKWLTAKPVRVRWLVWNSFLTVICDLYFHRQDVTEDDLRLLFSNAGGTVKAFKFFQYVDISISKISHMYPLNGLKIHNRIDLRSFSDSCTSLAFCMFVCTPASVLPVALTTVSYFLGIVKWLWSRCQQWRRPSRPWLTFTITTWEATSTWESPSQSPPFKNLTHTHLTGPGFTVRNLSDCVWTLGGDHMIESVLLLGFCSSCHSLRETETFDLHHFLKRKNMFADTESSQLFVTVPLYFYVKRNIDMIDCPPVW